MIILYFIDKKESNYELYLLFYNWRNIDELKVILSISKNEINSGQS